MAASSYAPRFVATIPQTWPSRVILLVLWPSYLKLGLLELCSSFCGHHASNMASSSYAPRFFGHHSSSMASSSYTPRFVAIIPQTRPPRLMLLVLWPSYFKHGLLELCSSFCGHHASNMASLSFAPHFMAIIPQTWPPRVMLLVLWPSYFKHGLLELCSSFCDQHASN